MTKKILLCICLIITSILLCGAVSTPLAAAHKYQYVNDTDHMQPDRSSRQFHEKATERRTSSTKDIDTLDVLPDLLMQLPMEDQYHSQVTETYLPNACGPTALLMVLDYYGLENSLISVIEKASFAPEHGGYDPQCVANAVCTSPGALVKIAQEDYQLRVNAREGWTFEEVGEAIALGYPIIADVVWRLQDDGPGHFVVIYGIDAKARKIYYHDPYDGPGMVADWDRFAASWDGPVDLGDPLQPEGHKYWGMTVLLH